MSLISKQIDELRAYAKDRNGELAKLINDAADTIEELSAKLHASNMERSSQYYNNGWIPCSERLPEKPFRCLLTIHTDCGDYVEGDWVCPVAHVWNGKTWNNGNGHPIELECFEEIIAWMPLPEPYKKSRN